MSKKSFFYLFAALFIYQSQLLAANACIDYFTVQAHEKEKLGNKVSTQFMKAAAVDSSSTTAARAEIKYTESKMVVDKLVADFKRKIEEEIPGYKLENRDAKTPGFRNITWTGYSNRFKLRFKDGKDLTAKIRVRKYGHIAESTTVAKENFKPLEWMNEVSFFEFKIENPEYANSVLKPRILIRDADADLLLNPNISKEDYAAILQRTIAVNTKKDPEAQRIASETATEMIEAIRLIHKKDNRFVPEFETLYERTSYVVPIIDPRTNNKVDIQITIDEDISTYSNLQQRYSTVYQTIDPVAVTEIKIPIPLLGVFKDAAAAQASGIPGMVTIYNFVQRLKFNSLKEFQENSGKLFHTRQNLDPAK